MNTNPVHLIVAALAVWHVVEVWHHSSLFAGWRAWFEVQDNLLARMLLCPFCFSMWVAVVATPFALPEIEPVTPRDFSFVWVWFGVQKVGFMLMVAFAIARVANLGNDLTHSYCRTPRDQGMPADPNSGIEKHDERPTGYNGQPADAPDRGPPADV